MNPYQYAPNSIGWVDPLGLKCGLQNIKANNGIHGNGNNSTNPNHVYVIVDTKTGKLMKPGISGRSLNKNGSSPRANQQVNKLNIDEPDRYKAFVVKKDISCIEAKALEQKITDKHAARNNGNMPSTIHKRPFPRVSTRQEYEELYGMPHNRS